MTRVALVPLRSAVVGIVVLAACGDDIGDTTCVDRPRGPAFASFEDVTESSGVSFQVASSDFKGSGLAVADFDGDGRADIVAGRRVGGVKLFRNTGKMKFVEVVNSGLDPRANATAMAGADLDNDGDQDLVIATHGALRIYRNHGDATFEQALELTDTGTTEHVLATDLDGNGLLDLYVGNYDLDKLHETANRLFLNRGNLSFELALTEGLGRTWTTTTYDFDDDGDQDLYVANDTLAFDFGAGPVEAYPFAVDEFLRNDGNDGNGVPILTDIAPGLGMIEPRSSMGGTLTDFDGDGLLDLFVPNYGANKLFVRTDGGYAERASAIGVDGPLRRTSRCSPDTDDENCLLLSWTAVVSDFDLDGHDELLLTNGETAIGGVPPVQLFTQGASKWEELAPSLPCLDARGAVATDLDGDGDQDVVISVKEGPVRVFENVHHPGGGTWIDVRLRGLISNLDGVGARVTLSHASGRTQSRVVGEGGVIHSTGPAEAFFSIADDPAVDVTVRWPSGAVTQVPATAGIMVVSE